MSNAAERKKWGESLIARLVKTEEEMETLYAHLRAIAANPDENWTGWRHAVEMLIPDSPARLEELKANLRSKGMGALADHLESIVPKDRR